MLYGGPLNIQIPQPIFMKFVNPFFGCKIEVRPFDLQANFNQIINLLHSLDTNFKTIQLFICREQWIRWFQNIMKNIYSCLPDCLPHTHCIYILIFSCFIWSAAGLPRFHCPPGFW